MAFCSSEVLLLLLPLQISHNFPFKRSSDDARYRKSAIRVEFHIKLVDAIFGELASQSLDNQLNAWICVKILREKNQLELIFTQKSMNRSTAFVNVLLLESLELHIFGMGERQRQRENLLKCNTSCRVKIIALI